VRGRITGGPAYSALAPIFSIPPRTPQAGKRHSALLAIYDCNGIETCFFSKFFQGVSALIVSSRKSLEAETAETLRDLWGEPREEQRYGEIPFLVAAAAPLAA
jgi:hypothetical protein